MGELGVPQELIHELAARGSKESLRPENVVKMLARLQGLEGLSEEQFLNAFRAQDGLVKLAEAQEALVGVIEQLNDAKFKTDPIIDDKLRKVVPSIVNRIVALREKIDSATKSMEAAAGKK